MTTTRHSPALLEDIRRRYGAGAGSFLAWWKQSLVSWLPLRWRSFLGLARERLLLSRYADQWQLQWQHPDGVLPVAEVPVATDMEALDRILGKRLVELPRWLMLPPDCVLRRRMLLPAAAAERLRDVVGFEIDRQTPFSAASVRYDAQVLGRRDDGQLDVELVAVPGARFDQAVAELGDLASSLVGVDAMDAQGRPLGVNLLPVALRRRRVDPMRRWNVVLVIVAALALVGAAWQVLDNRADAAAAFSAQVEEQAARARVVAAQRQRLVDMVEGAQFLAQARAGRPTTVEVLDELSRRLPDRTYMEKISIEGDRLLLIGFSPEPSALVGNLEVSDLWNSPALSGPLQPDPRTGLDRFSLTATLQGTPAPGSATQGVANGAGNP